LIATFRDILKQILNIHVVNTSIESEYFILCDVEEILITIGLDMLCHFCMGEEKSFISSNNCQMPEVKIPCQKIYTGTL